ncbi:MAG: rod shape-determining protein RodA [Candidatus Caenarcaniphilales bacterium]|nr:rod shape-determining protein RodA [Candidatus Caenarcaniphilales bacterium]
MNWLRKVLTFPLQWWANNRLDRIMLGGLMGLLIVGLVAQSSVTQGHFFNKHLLYLALGIPIFLIGYSIPTETLRKTSWIWYGVAVTLLVLVLVKGTSALGAQRWIAIGNFSLQPSEPAKLAVILALANWFYLRKPKSIFDFILAGGLVLLLPFGLILIQPDLGTAMILASLFISISFWAGALPAQILIILSPLLVMLLSALGPHFLGFKAFKIGTHLIEPGCSWLGLLFIVATIIYLGWEYKVKNFPKRQLALGIFCLALLGIGFLGRPLVWGSLEPYQQKRLTTFLDPGKDRLGAGWNIYASLMSVGSGRLKGQGYKDGYLTQGSFVPEQHTDFIFSSIAEEWGFIGSSLLILLFGMVCFRVLRVISQIENNFERLLGAGILTFFWVHVSVNIGMNIGLLPVTGVPLPFISYGGTSLWVSLISLGIIQRIYVSNFEQVMFKNKI